MNIKKGIEKIIVHKVSFLDTLWKDCIALGVEGDLFVSTWNKGFHSLISNECAIPVFELIFKWGLSGCSTEIVNDTIVLHGIFDAIGYFFSGFSFGHEGCYAGSILF
jgi:hypothetical protein